MFVALLTLVLAAAPPARETSVLIMPIQARGGVDKDLAEQITAWVAAQSAKVPGYRIVAYREVEGAMTQEQIRQLAGCDELSCAAEIAGALNTEEVVLGSLGLVGGSYVLTLTRIRARDAAVPGRVAERFSGGKTDALLDRIPRIVASLFGVGAPKPVASTPGVQRVEAAPPAAGHEGPSALVWALRGVGVAGLGVGVMVLLTGAAVMGLGFGIVAYDQVRGTPERHAVPQTVGILSNVAVVAGVGAVPLAILVAAAGTGLAAVSMVLP